MRDRSDGAGMQRTIGGLSRIVLAVAACVAVQAGRLGGQAIRDSAGIRIVDNQAAAWTPATAWRFSSAPTVQIGAVEGDSSVLLHRTRFATRLADGRIIVAQPFELRIFSPSGTFIRTIGRRGRGPGEFALGISGVATLPGDSIVVNQSRSVMIFDAEGTYARSFVSVPPGLLRDHRTEGGRLLPDGSVILTLHPPEPREWSVGIIRPQQGYVRVARGGSRADTAGFFPGTEQVVAVGGERPEIEVRPFGRRVLVAAGGDRVFIGDNAAYEIRGFTLDGLRPRLIIRRERAPIAVTAGDRAAWIERQRATVASIPPDRRAVEGPMAERRIARADFPRTKPAFAQLEADRLGNLWVTETPADTGAPRMAVYDRNGRLLGEVVPPSGVAILEIGADYMFGLWRNEDDVEFIRVYSLIKP